MNNRNYKGVHTALSLLVALLFLSALFTRCANIVSPSGGPKDTLPPLIVTMVPENFTTNIDTLVRRIYIEFDEFVTITDQSKEFFTSPQMKTKPQLQTRGRGVVVTMRDTLLSNTTYALNFGSSIRDNNEGNTLFSLRYVFSTGDKIDSMILSGYAEDSYKPDSVSGALILLYPADSIDMQAEYDSTIFNSTPAIITRAEANGIFLAQNLKPIPYYIYAIEDTNNNFTYEPGTDKIGFLDGTFNPAELPDFSIWYDSLRKYVVAEPQLHFRLFTDNAFKRQLLIDSERPLQHKAILSFGAEYPQIDSLIFDSIPEEQVMIEYLTRGKDTLALWFNTPAESIPDTIRGRVVYFKHDSIRQLERVSENLALTWRYFETKEQERERVKLEKEREKALESGEEWVEPEEENPFKVTMSTNKEIHPETPLIFDFEYPIARMDSTSIKLQYLSAEAVSLRNELVASGQGGNLATARGAEHPYRLHRDTQNIRRWHLSIDWGKIGDEYYLSIPQGAITDIAGFVNDSITQEYTIQDPSKYATLVVNIKEDNSAPSEYLLELMDEAGKKILDTKTNVTAGQVQFNYVPAGAVSLRITQDKNGNGRWDSGDLVNRIQPERAQFFENEGLTAIATKVNWEIEITIDPEAMFAPENQEQLTQRLEEQERKRLANLKSGKKSR